MRCYFCNGNIHLGRCIQCARTTDIAHELWVIKEQKKEHKNWHSWHGESERLSRAGKINPGGYGRRKNEQENH